MNFIVIFALLLACFSSTVSAKRLSRGTSLPTVTSNIHDKGEYLKYDNDRSTIVAQGATKFELPKALKLLIGAGGIYAAFLYYGTLQEDVFHYVAADGSKFTQAWFLQALGTCSC
jgi:hypothetical protein